MSVVRWVWALMEGTVLCPGRAFVCVVLWLCVHLCVLVCVHCVCVGVCVARVCVCVGMRVL